jgi:predicted phosphohydrolase
LKKAIWIRLNVQRDNALLIRCLNDLHNEFGDFVVPQLPEDNKTILVLSGDIDNIKRKKSIVKFLETVSNQFKLVIYVFGNHEAYKSSLINAKTKLENMITHLDNINVLENQFIVHDDVLFVGATLWTNFNSGDPHSLWQANKVMNDYKYIRYGKVGDPYKRHLSPEDVYIINKNSKKFIFDTVNQQRNKCRKIVVVTHHLPSYILISPEFKNSSYNYLYASELFEDIYNSGIDYWFFGHTHSTTKKSINKTRLICNPRGYYPNDLNKNFDKFLRYDV